MEQIFTFFLISEEDLKFLLFSTCSECICMDEICIQDCYVKKIAARYDFNINEIVRNSE